MTNKIDFTLDGSTKGFRDLVASMSEEWCESGGYITCEFATSVDNLVEKQRIIDIYSKQLDNGFWSMNVCSTCIGYHPDKPIHVAIHHTEI